MFNHNEGPIFTLELRKGIGLPELKLYCNVKIHQIHDERSQTLEIRKSAEYNIKGIIIKFYSS